MPWPHCDLQVNDDVACPKCGMTKLEWTIKVASTRVFKLGGKKACKVVLYQTDGTTYAEGAAYRIELPDGTIEEGALNPAGYAKAQTRLPGLCWVSFPGDDLQVCISDAVDERDGRFGCEVRDEKYVF